ncbi:hypothetical protein LshimejAT787_1700110 [Lyophyllum shimeji]|uniref:Uncharacterized protein n=1 Tax=Lyophyllum shimeji TaxID=47721 RepID=A0A9P3PZK0_LYOSH|nr:hypothetical protein LshimejAT787_1700110 [Lyophyllum shimeji]
MRKTCRRMYTISKLRIIWTNACAKYILQKGYPFTTHPLEAMSVSELEQRTVHAYHLASRWLSGPTRPRRTLHIDATSHTAVSDVRFVPGYSGERILTVSKGIWDMLTIWDVVSASPNADARRACECEHNVHLIELRDDAAGGGSALETIRTIRSSMKPVKLHGDVLALCDDVSRTEVWNWRTGASAVLQEPVDDEEGGIWQPNRSIQVVFAHHSVLVVRASSIHLFPEPELDLLPTGAEPRTYAPSHATPSAGSTASPSPSPSPPPAPAPAPSPSSSAARATTPARAPPYLFPPALVTQVPAVRGSLRCRTVVLGACGTAVWIQPQDRAVVGLAGAADDEYEYGYPLQAIHQASGHESLVVAAFPGPFADAKVGREGGREGEGEGEREGEGGEGGEGGEERVAATASSVVCTNSLNNWMALDYDEEMGRVALCSSFGRVLVLEL